MHRAIIIVGLALVGCGGRGNDGNSAKTVSSTTVTSAEARADQRTASDRMGEAICAHEVECGRPQPASCLRDSTFKAEAELQVWTCEPAEYRASTQQCLAAIREESCNVDLRSRPNVCPLATTCRRADVRDRLVPPGRVSAEVW